MHHQTKFIRALGSALTLSLGLGLASWASADGLPDPLPEGQQASAGSPRPPPAEMIGEAAPTLPEPTLPPAEMVNAPGPSTLPEQAPKPVGVQLDLNAIAEPEPAHSNDMQTTPATGATQPIAALGLGLLALVLLGAFFVLRRR